MLKLLDRITQSTPRTPTTRLARIRSLEPRMVFDAAAAPTAAAAVAASNDHHDATANDNAADHPAAANDHASDPQVHAATVDDPRAGATTGSGQGVDIVVIDSNVPDIQTLLRDLPQNAEVIMIDSSRDGVEQLAQALQGRTDIGAIHIVSHGEAGELHLGTSIIDAQSITGQYAAEFAAIGRSFTADADMLVYGCDFGAGANGAAAVHALAQATGLDIAASDDATGHESRGGDWDLEVHDGSIEHSVIFDRATQDAWEHVLARANITITGDPVVRDGSNTPITGTTANGVTTYNINSNVVGSTSVWQNAGTVDGVQISLRATVVAIGESDDLVSFRTTGDDATVLIRDDANANSNGNAQVEIKWEILNASTGQPVSVDVDFRIGDIDGIGGAPNTRETVSTATSNLSSYTVGNPTDLQADTSGGRVSISGTQDENNPSTGTISSQSIAGFSYANKTSFNITYRLTANTVTGQAAFQHDGDFDLAITDPQTVYVPQLDLDGNDSSGVTGTGYHDTYVATGSGVPVVDTDVAITNDGGQLTNATVTLTNVQTGDALNVGALPAGITAGAPDTSVPGQITIHLTGAASAADYQTALHAITFSNSNGVPNVTDRLIDVSVANDHVSSDVARSTISVDRLPVAANDTFTTPEDTSVVIDVRNNDSDPDGDTITVTQVNGVAIAVGGSVSVANGTVTLNSSGNLVFQPAADYNGTPSFNYTISDGRGGTATATVNGTVTAVNDAPINTLPTSFSTPEDTSVVLSGISVSDVDAGGGQISVTLGVASGTLTATAAGGVTVSGSGTGSITLTGTLAQINSLLASNAPSYTPVANANGPVTLTMTTNDKGNTGSGGALTDVDTATINVAAVNDAPVNTLPTNFSTNEDTSVALTGISVSDVDAGTSSISVTLAVGSGRLNATSAGGVTVSGSGTGTITLTGSVTQINSYLASANAPTFTPAANANGPVTLTMTTNDNGNTGSGGPLTDVDTATINVAAVNDAPVNTLPPTFSTNEDTSVVLSGISVADVDAGSGQMSVTLGVGSGTLTATAAGGVTVSGSGTGTITLTGTLAQINGYLASANAPTFTPVADANGPVTLTMTTNDNGNTGSGGPLTDVDTATINVAAVNDAPVNTLPANFSAQEDTGVALTGISVSDVDAGTSSISVTLAVGSGRLNATSAGGVTVSGSGTGTITLTGSVTQINSYLASANAPVFTPGADANGPVTLTMTTNDNGNTGSGGAKTDVDTSTINVSAVNDAPVNTLPPTFSTNEETSVVLSGISVADVDAGSGQISVTLGVGSGTLTATAAGGVTISGSGTGTITLTGTLAQINGYLASANAPTFTPVADANGPVTLTMTTNDNGNTGSGGPLSDVDTATINVAAVNDAPVNTLPSSFSTAEDTPVTLTGISVSDVDAATGPISVTLNVGSGSLAATSAGGVTVAGSGTGTITLTGTLAQINGYLASANAPVFTPGADANGPVTLTMTTNDNGNTGSGGPLTDVDTATINVSAVNDAPVNTMPAGYSTPEDTPLPLSGLSVTDVDAGSGPISVTLNVGSGTLTATAAGGVTVAGSGTGTITLTGTLANINGYLSSNAPTFTPVANAHAPVTLTMTTNDNGNTGSGGPLSDVDTRTIDVTSVNDAPVATNDAVSTPEDTPVTLDVRTNDTDVDGDPLTVTQVNGTAITVGGAAVTVANGTVTLGTDGRLTFTPNANFNGPTSFTYTVSDGQGGTATATVNVTVTPVNDAPVNTMPAGYSTAEDTPLPLSGLSVSDVDAGAGTISVTLNVGSGRLTATAAGGVGVAGSGTGTITLTGTLAQINGYLSSNAPTFTPVANAHAPVTLTMTTNDNGNTGAGGPLSDVDTRTINVTSVNDAPVGTSPGTQNTNDSGTVNLPLGPQFTDADGDPLTYTATGLPPGLTIDPNTGVVSGTLPHDASQGGPYTVTVTATDPSGAAATITFTWQVANPDPIANPDTATTNVGTPVTIPVLANDSDPDGDTLSVTGATAGHGTVTVNPNGTVTYTPTPGYAGPDTITYTLTDSDGGTATGTVTVDVNTPPTAQTIPPRSSNDGQSVTLPVAPFFNDPDGDPLTYSATGLPPGLSINPNTGLISGTLAHDASAGAPYSVTVTANDGHGGTVSTTFTWAATNPAPTANHDTATTAEDTPVTIPVLANDTDPDGDPLTVVSATAGHGTIVINPNGTITYTPAANYNGPDTITYTIRDSEGATSTATVDVTVSPVNDAPVGMTPPDRANGVGSTVNVDLTPYFSDPEGDPLTYTAGGLPPGLSIDPSGHVTGTIQGPPGAPYTVTVTVTDPSGAQTTVSFEWTVSAVAPTTVDDVTTTPEDTPTTVNVLTNDSDPNGETLTLTSATAAHGTVQIQPNGTVTYTPNPNFNGDDTVTYTVTNTDGATATGTLTVHVTPVNDPPVASPVPPQSSNDGTAVNVPLAPFFNDPDSPTLTYTATGLPPGLTIDPATGTVTGTLPHDASQGGPYTVTVTATDPAGATASTTFTWQVNNPPPVTGHDTATTLEDTPVTIPVLANDSDPDGDPLTVTGAVAAHGTVVINPNGTLTYTPDANFNGVDTISYQVSDGDGGVTTATVSVTVTPVNDPPATMPIPDRSSSDGQTGTLATAPYFSDPEGDPLTYSATGLPPGLSIDPATGVVSGTIAHDASAHGPYAVTVTADDGHGGVASITFGWTVANPAPIAQHDDASTAEDTPVTIPVLANDSDPDGDTISVTGAVAGHGVVVINPNGTLTYTPDANFNGTDTITYQITDSDGATATATVTVVVTPVNDAPVATQIPNRSSSDGEAGTLPTAPYFNDPDGDPLTYSATGLPPGLAIDPATGVVSGTIAHDASAHGPYTVTISGRDPSGAVATVTFTWSVANPAPIAQHDDATTAEDTPVTIPVLANDSDPDGDTISVTGATAGHGTVVINPNGTLTYTPAANFNGTDTITYQITDSDGATATATVTVTVTPVNDAPVATPAPDQANADSQHVSVPISGYFSDVDGDTLAYGATGLPPGLSIDPATGVISGTLAHDASGATGNGTYIVTVTASDGHGGTATTTFAWVVSNPAPNASPDSATTPHDRPITIDVLANDSDPDGDPLTVTSATAGHGTVVIGPNGVLTYTPNAGFTGTDTIVYAISDGNGGTAMTTVTVTVTPNHPPVAGDQTHVTGIGQPVRDHVSATDQDGDPLSYVLGDAPGHGTVVLGPDGTYVYRPANGYTGPDSFTVVVSDGQGGSTIATINITVSDRPAAPPPPPSPPLPYPPPVHAADPSPSMGDAGDPNGLGNPRDVAVDGIVVDTVREVDDLHSTSRVDLVDGAVLAAVNGVSRLDGIYAPAIGGIVEREVRREDYLRPTRPLLDDGLIGLRDGYDAAPYLGRSLELTADGDRSHAVMLEAVRNDGSLTITVHSLVRGHHGELKEYSLRCADGRPLPRWLERGDGGAFWGRPPTDLQSLDLIVRFVFSDGTVIERTVTVDVQTGEIHLLREQRSESPLAAPMFTAQLAAATGRDHSTISDLEKALGF